MIKTSIWRLQAIYTNNDVQANIVTPYDPTLTWYDAGQGFSVSGSEPQQEAELIIQGGYDLTGEVYFSIYIHTDSTAQYSIEDITFVPLP